MGNRSSIHANCWVEAIGGVAIGDYVAIAHNSSIVSANHSWADVSKPIKLNATLQKPINIEDDVWVGCGVRVLCGVRIGRRSVIGAGAVVTHDVPENSIAVGVPARVRGCADEKSGVCA